MAKLVIKSDGMPTEVIELKRGVNRFGRSASNDFQIQHASVSRFHCEIEVNDDAMFVRDMDSSNGTYVNNQPVGQAQLETGQVLRLGQVNMEVQEAPVRLDKERFVPCVNHPKLPASMECKQCQKTFCGACVHILQCTDEKILRLCPVCSGYCLPIHVSNQSGENSHEWGVRNRRREQPIQQHKDKTNFLGNFVNKLLKKSDGSHDHD